MPCRVRRLMKSIADGLPPGIANRVHPDWRKNEAAYWAVRDTLLSQYGGRWIGFANGTVIASGTSPVEVFDAIQQSVLHPFVICVGREDEPSRMRRASFACDSLPRRSPAAHRRRIPTGQRFTRTSPGPGHSGHGRGCQCLALGRLSATPARSSSGSARVGQWRVAPLEPSPSWCGRVLTGTTTPAGCKRISSARSGSSDGTFSTASKCCFAGLRGRWSPTYECTAAAPGWQHEGVPSGSYAVLSATAA
jgi:hypothetical protein